MDLIEKFIKFHDITVVNKEHLDIFLDELSNMIDDGFFFTIRVKAFNKKIKYIDISTGTESKVKGTTVKQEDLQEESE